MRLLNISTNTIYSDISEIMQLQDVVEPLYDCLFRPIAQLVFQNTGDRIHDQALEETKNNANEIKD